MVDQRGDTGGMPRAETREPDFVRPDLQLPWRPMSPPLPLFIVSVVACWTLSIVGHLYDPWRRIGLSLGTGLFMALAVSLGSARRCPSMRRVALAALGTPIASSVAGAVLIGVPRGCSMDCCSDWRARA